MSKSFNLKVSFNLRATVPDEDIKSALRDLEDYRAGKGLAKNHQAEAMVQAYDAGGIDALLATAFKLQFRELRSLVMETAEGSDLHHFSPFHVEITPRG
ncbi:hypothetical protein [Pseudomonas sp. USHLN015]|uniref:hypothetical protein n=1 Tax=Pseudomonas sp. USHLN015 TaxID=3081296 RepID=UPI00301C436A